MGRLKRGTWRQLERWTKELLTGKPRAAKERDGKASYRRNPSIYSSVVAMELDPVDADVVMRLSTALLS